MTTNRLAKSDAPTSVTAQRARELARRAMERQLPEHARAWNAYADEMDRNRPADGKTRAAGG